MKALVTGSTRKIGMAAVYALAKEGYTVVGTDESKLPLNKYSRHLYSHYIHAPFGEDKFYDNLLLIIKKEKPDVLIPIGGTKQISLHKNDIKKYVNVIVPDYESFRAAYDKRTTYDICREASIAMPQRLTDLEASLLLENNKNTMLVIKPNYDIGGAKYLSYVNNIKELEAAKRNILKNNDNYIIEEFIPGAIRTRTVQLLFDKSNKLIGYFILKKIHQWPVTGGNTAYAVSTNEYELLNFIMPFFEKCPWEGPVSVQLIIDERTNTPKLIEINPRFSGSLAFAIQCGVNLPYMASKAALNIENFNVPSYQAGKFYIHLSYFLKAIVKEFLISRDKLSFERQVFNEIKNSNVGVIIDKKDFQVYVAKILAEVKHFILSKRN